MVSSGRICSISFWFFVCEQCANFAISSQMWSWNPNYKSTLFSSCNFSTLINVLETSCRIELANSIAANMLPLLNFPCCEHQFHHENQPTKQSYVKNGRKKTWLWNKKERNKSKWEKKCIQSAEENGLTHYWNVQCTTYVRTYVQIFCLNE